MLYRNIPSNVVPTGAFNIIAIVCTKLTGIHLKNIGDILGIKLNVTFVTTKTS